MKNFWLNNLKSTLMLCTSLIIEFIFHSFFSMMIFMYFQEGLNICEELLSVMCGYWALMIDGLFAVMLFTCGRLWLKNTGCVIGNVLSVLFPSILIVWMIVYTLLNQLNVIDIPFVNTVQQLQMFATTFFALIRENINISINAYISNAYCLLLNGLIALGLFIRVKKEREKKSAETRELSSS